MTEDERADLLAKADKAAARLSGAYAALGVVAFVVRPEDRDLRIIGPAVAPECGADLLTRAANAWRARPALTLN